MRGLIDAGRNFHARIPFPSILVVREGEIDIEIGTTTIWGCYDGVAGQTLSSGASLASSMWVRKG